jgi:predicted Zn-dependent protease
MERRQYHLAAQHLEQACKLAPELKTARRDLAWVLVAADDPTIRHPARALELIQDLDHTAEAPPLVLRTLAAVYAANGQGQRADRYARWALESAEREGDADVLEQIRSSLQQ